jgi:DNA-binding transcriptional regulator GbsR (MarR family)
MRGYDSLTLPPDRLDNLSVASDISVMTEITDNRKSLPLAIERFVLHWGEMGGNWGVNRSVSQIHALLYLSERPLTAEEIADTLGLARSNVSNSIKELLAWDLIRRVPIRGDRRDHFEAEADVWEVFLRIAAGRKEREIDPAVAVLKACSADAERDAAVPPLARTRLKDMLAFMEMMERFYTQMLTVPKPQIATAVKLGAKVLNFLPGAKRKA